MKVVREKIELESKSETPKKHIGNTLKRKNTGSSDRCIDCGETLLHEGGCAHCYSCGWSACP